MRIKLWAVVALLVSCGTRGALAELPAPQADLVPYSMAPAPASLGALSAADLLAKPAGARGPVVARDGHFYTGDQRIRFWGVNLCFSACFPSHDQADYLARRLAQLGFNIVRFHHMDNQPFPGGIFADRSLERLSPEALDRLDYLVAALKREGIYTNLNLHVSRQWSRVQKWPGADEVPDYDKMVDLFYPPLVEANQRYARELLSHVNAYTRTAYAAEPAVAMVEINNEDTLFLWGGEQKLESLPDPYARTLRELWNRWLAARYRTRDALGDAWNRGAQSAGKSLLADGDFAQLGRGTSPWRLEQHEQAKITATVEKSAAILSVAAVDGTDWHLQFNQAGLKLHKDQFYRLRFTASADRPRTIHVAAAMAHEPWNSLGLAADVKLEATPRPFEFGFTASADDEQARVSFSLGDSIGTVRLSGMELCEGGQQGLRPEEDPGRGTVACHSRQRLETAARSADWFDFLQQTDQGHFVQMRKFLKDTVGVKCPVTGTIALGMLGAAGQAQMDFVDAHAYWDHPNFPRRPWDPQDWIIHNRPMVDDPAGATLWRLAACRVADKPFTVTEYNHSAPNEWQAECVPLIASFAALQDWDAVFLFTWSHSNPYGKDRISSYFDLDGNPLKLAQAPLAARLLLGRGGIPPISASRTIAPQRAQMLATASAHYDQAWSFLERTEPLRYSDVLNSRLAIDFSPSAKSSSAGDSDRRMNWTAAGPGTGQVTVNDPHAALFVGFLASAMDIGPLRIERSSAPFVSIMLVPADPTKTLAEADRLLLTVVARAENAGMKWDAQRRSVGTWGSAPPQVEVVKGELSIALPQAMRAWALDAAGRRGDSVPVRWENGRLRLQIGQGKAATLAYELDR